MFSINYKASTKYLYIERKKKNSIYIYIYLLSHMSPCDLVTRTKTNKAKQQALII